MSLYPGGLWINVRDTIRRAVTARGSW